MTRTHSSPVLPPEELNVVGHGCERLDGPTKVSGTARYVDDLEFVGMLHCAAATSEEPHALLLGIDIAEATAMPGVVCVMTAADLPAANQIGVSKKDQPLLATGKVRWVGDRLAIIAAHTAEQARAAARKVKGRYEKLPGVYDVEHALDADAPKLHEGGNLIAKGVVKKGDAARAIENSAIVLSNRYQVDWQEHAYLETQGSIAVPDEHGGMTIYGSMQCPFYVQSAIAEVLSIPLSKVRVVQTVTGGGFGGKEDYPSEPAACAAVLAHKTGRPVKFVLNREEDMRFSTKREKMVIRHTLGANTDGTINGVKIEVLVDAGAYAGLTAIVAERGNSSAVGPYRIPNVQVDTSSIYTCNAFSGAYRGFGHPQVAVAHEAQMEELAKRVGMDSAQIRRLNLLDAGDVNASGETLSPPVEAKLTLEAALERLEWDHVRQQHQQFNATHPTRRRGVGIGTIAYGSMLHAGGQFLEGAGALVQVHRDGSVSFAIGNTEMGQGVGTVVAQVLCEGLGVTMDAVMRVDTDTRLVPDSGPTVASRSTTMSGNAVLDACNQLKARMTPVAAELLACKPQDVCFASGQVKDTQSGKHMSFAELAKQCFPRKVHLAASGWYAPPRKPYDFSTGQGQAYSSYAYATQIAEVEVDLVTGRTHVLRVVAAHDVGKALFPDGVFGQIEGGIVQGMGYALMERLIVEEGRIRTANFTDYLIPCALDMPRMDIVLIEESPQATGEAPQRVDGSHEQALGPYGSKGVGEPSLIPMPAAVHNAVADAIGHPLRMVPCTPERVMKVLVETGLDPFAPAPA